METKMMNSETVIHSTVGSPKILQGSSQNYQRVMDAGDRYERPIMLNVWTQTTADDFGFLNEIETKGHQSQKEKELLEKIRVLEERLRAHADLLFQIHATSERTSALLGQNMHTISQNVAHQNMQSSLDEGASPLPPKIVNVNTNVSTSSIINPLHQVGQSAESFKYTIIAEGSHDACDEPIEIQLAEDDGAINMNNSADSGRLEICLMPEEAETKTEVSAATSSNINANSVQEVTTPPISQHSEHHLIKRRKLAAEFHADHDLPGNSNFLLSEHGRVTPVNSKNGSTSASVNRRFGNNSLLKVDPQQSSTSHANDNGYIRNNDIEQNYNADNIMVSIGPNNTRIPANIYETVNWTSASMATRKLLMTIFDRPTLATHSMTGKPSPAFKDHGKPLKQMLNPLIIQDIIFAVTRKCNVSEKEVRTAITTKCADENKMMKLQKNKLAAMRDSNKENIAKHIKRER
uniref:BEN domain-containing protein n=1 Tax=Glossina palpalis gambiensis TaxID=67801 RepID=A0A1B0C0N8_9MUSC